mgnify:CR=1 FL=1
MSGLSGLVSKSADAARPGMKAGGRLAAKGGLKTANATGKLLAAGTGKAVSAWQKRAAAIDSMQRLNQQRNR